MEQARKCVILMKKLYQCLGKETESMEYEKMISDLEPGNQIEGYYILHSAQIKTTANGRPYLNALLGDCSGAVEAKCWDYAGPIGITDEGKVLKIRGTVSEYRGALQLTIERLRLAEEADRYDRSRLVPTAPIDFDASYAEVERLVESIEDDGYRAVCREMLVRKGQALRTIPAAKSVHHGFIGGLLMHTCQMMQMADFLAKLYSDTVDRSLLLAGTLLHDLAKVEEFVKENGFKGQIDIDIFEKDGIYYFSEVNPRFGGGYPHAYACGIDHMNLIKNNLFGKINERKIGGYATNKVMMKYNEIMIMDAVAE